MLTFEGQKLNSRYDTDQGRVLISRWTFTVLDRNPNQGYRWFSLKSASPKKSRVLIEKLGSPKRPLQNFPNSIFFNFAKQYCLILIIVIMSEMKSEKFDIENKCSTICLCRIVLQTFNIKIKKIEP